MNLICRLKRYSWKAIADALDPDFASAVAEATESLEGIEYTPVIHGKWIKARGSWRTPGGDPVWEFSECGKGMHVYGIEHGTYGSDVVDGQWVACPNCGARMDGGKNG